MMKKMMVLYNETSGSSESKEIAERFKKAAEAKGEAVILQPSNPDIDPEEMRKNAKMVSKASSSFKGILNTRAKLLTVPPGIIPI